MAGESKILVVDDEPNVCKSCRDILGKRSWRVETAFSGNECITKTRDSSYDVVILDLKIPDVAGSELLQSIRQRSPETLVIIITGYSTVASAVEMMRMGAFEYLQKPFTPSEMRDAVTRALEARREAGGGTETPAPPPAPSIRATGFLSPGEIAEKVAEIGDRKLSLPVARLLLLGLLAGVYIGFGAELSTIVTHDLAKHVGAGFARLIGGSVFSVGLMLVIIAGAELFTGNSLCVISILSGKARTRSLLRNWSLVYLANFAGSILLVSIMYHSGLWKTSNLGVGASALKIAAAKLDLSFMEAFFRGIGCNWLVCLAVWMAVASKDIAGKMLGVFFPIMAFVASGFEHSVANMYFIPMGLLLKGDAVIAGAAGLTGATGGLTWSNFLAGNLLPVTLGNIVGGALFVACIYYLVYLRPEKASGNETITVGKVT